MAATLAKHHDTPPFADHKDLHNVIDAMQLGDVPWQCFSAQYTGEQPEVVPPWMDEEFEVWYRDPCAMAHNILANPTYKDEIDYVPFCEYDASDEMRQWKDFMSGDWAWQQAVRPPSLSDPETHGPALIPIILGSDKTTVSVGTGNNEYYPLYASIGNVRNNVQCTHCDALVIISFLAIPKTDKTHSKDDLFRIFCRQLFHGSLSVILSSLKPVMTEYEVVCCGDRHFWHIIYSLGPYIADYEEQLVLSCIVKHWCPKCIAVHTNLDGDATYHTHKFTDFLINELHVDVLWDEFGLIGDLIPFTNDFPRADIHELLSFDLFHQLIKGAFKDHLVDWVAKYLKAMHGTKWSEEIVSDIDRRVAAVPSFSGLQHFPQGHDFKQWTGDDSKVLMKVFLPAIEGHVPQDMVCAFRALLEFCYLVQCNVITEDTLIQIQDTLGHFHRYRTIFENIVPTFSLPHQHSMVHYVDMIRLFGAPNGLCSLITESKHIKAVKEPWRWSNRHNALGQMLVTNQHLDKLTASHADFDAQGMLTGTILSSTLAALGKSTVAALAHEVALQVFNSAAATFYAPSDLSGIGGMRHEHIHAYAEGMRGLKVARVICFFSFKHNWEWFEKIGDCPDEDTGMWMVAPSFHEDGSRNLAVIHIEMVFHAAHLIAIYGSEYIPHSLKLYHSLDTFSSFYVNKYADHHAFEIAS
ncbi:uncharacterized protein BJ212DRAFT_1446794 [Suillus subaureus]|uniref:Uncharacterized protein n=1 Tax=Suillus subaureus TaxID=48587 RepID=A0A9P7EB68_9AGAM|nr:uncharacterized protein BJ212DRAFT_1446794 [Suillus subaureus]KAG1816667.1 hypothetical protein BJ212DRAFT_1446794 [Suillus subaureus]